MACDLTLGRLEPCKDSIGGINAVYFINYDDAGFALTYDVHDTDVITSLGLGVEAYKYELKGTSSFDQAITSSRDNGTTFFEQTLTLSLKKLTKEDHKELKLLAWGRPRVLVSDRNGNIFVAGLQHGMDVTEGSVASGAALGDFNGYTLTLSGQEPVPANFAIQSGADADAVVTALGCIITEG